MLVVRQRSNPGTASGPRSRSQRCHSAPTWCRSMLPAQHSWALGSCLGTHSRVWEREFPHSNDTCEWQLFRPQQTYYTHMVTWSLLATLYMCYDELLTINTSKHLWFKAVFFQALLSEWGMISSGPNIDPAIKYPGLGILQVFVCFPGWLWTLEFTIQKYLLWGLGSVWACAVIDILFLQSNPRRLAGLKWVSALRRPGPRSRFCVPMPLSSLQLTALMSWARDRIYPEAQAATNMDPA